MNQLGQLIGTALLVGGAGTGIPLPNLHCPDEYLLIGKVAVLKAIHSYHVVPSWTERKGADTICRQQFLV